MNICYLSDARAEHTRRWVKYFALKGHQVDLITLNPDVLDGYEPVRVHVIKKPVSSSGLYGLARNFLPVLKELKSIISGARPGILHAHSAGAYAWLAMACGFRPYVITPWGTDILIDVQESRLIRYFTVRSLNKAELITCDGINMKNEIVKLGVNADKIRLVIFGVDLRRFNFYEDSKSEFRKKYGIGERKIVVSTRTLTPVHDVQTFVRSIPLIKETVPEAVFVIVGDGTERKSLEELAKSLGIYDSTRFIGRVEEDEMAQCLSAADVYVSTSMADSGLAASTAEAMACKLPAVVTDNGDNSDWVIENKGGFIVPASEPEIMAKQIIRLLQDDELRQELGLYNRAVIEDRNNYVKEMDKMESFYMELANVRR